MNGKQGQELMVNERPLRFVDRELYQLLLDECESKHVHSYDIKASAIADKLGVTLILRFGDDLNHCKETFFTHQSIRQKDIEVRTYLQMVTEECKEVIIRDYYKMLKPKKGEV